MNLQYKQDFLRAGELAREVRLYGKSLIKKGASYNDVIFQINKKIESLGARPAFPPQIALNDVAAHFLPQPDEDIIFSDEVVKLDIGVCYNGAIGDCAVTIDLSGKQQLLIDAAEAALLAAEQNIKVGLKIREIGKLIEDTIVAHGFKPIKNLSGHGLGQYKIHTSPTIPNFDDRSTTIFRPGMTFAIEPFATTGKGIIHAAGTSSIFSFIASRPLQSDIARTLLTKIRSFNGLPFAIHDLMQEGIALSDVKKAIQEMIHARVIADYPPLVEERRGMVAQAENSVLIDQKGIVTITTR
jgi:methionyl aminopeptidase